MVHTQNTAKPRCLGFAAIVISTTFLVRLIPQPLRRLLVVNFTQERGWVGLVGQVGLCDAESSSGEMGLMGAMGQMGQMGLMGAKSL